MIRAKIAVDFSNLERDPHLRQQAYKTASRRHWLAGISFLGEVREPQGGLWIPPPQMRRSIEISKFGFYTYRTPHSLSQCGNYHRICNISRSHQFISRYPPWHHRMRHSFCRMHGRHSFIRYPFRRPRRKWINTNASQWASMSSTPREQPLAMASGSLPRRMNSLSPTAIAMSCVRMAETVSRLARSMISRYPGWPLGAG